MGMKVRALAGFTLAMSTIPIIWMAGMCLVGWARTNQDLKLVVIDLWKNLVEAFNG